MTPKTPIVMLGFGNVGQSVARLLDENDGYRAEGAQLELSAVFDRRGGIIAEGIPSESLIQAKKREGSVTGVAGAASVTLENALNVAGAVFVDSSITSAETGEPGLTPSRRALERGCPVVFASKGPLVAAYEELVGLAREQGVRLGAGAAVGIPLPSLEVGVSGLRGTGLRSIRAVLNDTTNQILRDLEEGTSLDEAIERARRAGTIEEDPRLDLEGWDAAYKLLILARAFWSGSLSFAEVATTGVGHIGKKELDEARDRGARLRLIATGERDKDGKIHLRVQPEALTQEDPLYPLGPGEKGAVFETDVMGRIMLRSSQSGPKATAAAVLKDVLNIVMPPIF